MKAEPGQTVSYTVNSFLYTAERKDRTVYFSALRNGERENFFGAGGSGLTLGELTGRAKAQINDADVRVTWMLIGDPTMKLR